MSIQEIPTGYKPEFALGGVFAGENAANIEMGNQLELIKNYLANQHAQVQNPLDEETTRQNLLANMYKTDPRYQTGMIDTISGQGKSNLAAGTTAEALQPFKQKAEQSQLAQDTIKNSIFSNMYNKIVDQYDSNKTDEQRAAAGQQGYALADTLSELDPTFMQKMKLLHSKNDAAIEIAESKRSDPKYKEQLAQAFKIKADPNASPQDRYEAEMFIYLDTQSRLASNPSAYTPKMDLPAMTGGKVINQPAPVVQSVPPKPPSTPTQSMSISDFRKQYPQYDHVSDADLITAASKKGMILQ